VSRFYTAARRHPWVLGKVADWKIPLGPYTPAQIALAVAGGFLLVKTASWWSWMFPLPLVAWVLAIWAVRRPKIRGRAPMQAALGWVLLGWQPRGGRIGPCAWKRLQEGLIQRRREPPQVPPGHRTIWWRRRAREGARKASRVQGFLTAAGFVIESQRLSTSVAARGVVGGGR
jgi:hypothetical protein